MLLLVAPGPLFGVTAAHPSIQATEVGQGSTTLIPNHLNSSLTGLLLDNQVNPFLAYSKEPAPMGIADYGLGPAGPYSYSTNSSLGKLVLTSLLTSNSTGSPWMTMQLNVNLQFTANSKLYVYWIQDVVVMDTANNTVVFENNIWNFSASNAILKSSGLSGSGSVLPDGKLTYYATGAGSLPGNDVALTLPSSIELEVNSTVSGSGQSMVSFSYNDGFGLQTYDRVTFLTSGKLAMPGFTVNGSSYNPHQLFYDSELILGGPGGGLSTSDVSSDLVMQLLYFNGHNYETVPNAYNFGVDTGESIGNTLSQWFYATANGENVARIQAGAGSLGTLYDTTLIGTFVFKSSFSTGILDIQNATDVSATPDPHPFVGGQATVTVYPGKYLLQLSENGALTSLGTFTVTAGQVVTIPSQVSGTQLTLSYTVQAGGVGYSPPVLSYVVNGIQQSAPLTTTPASFTLDMGSAWSVSGTLLGSSSTERWSTSQTTTGVATSNQTILFVYQHQLAVSVDYSVTGGGFPPPPLLGYFSFSTSRSILLTGSPQSLWLDYGSSFSVPALLGGSTTNERWGTSAGAGSVVASGTVTFTYYHQYRITILYQVSGGGGGYGAPSITCTVFGSPTSTPEGSSLWADAGSSCVYSGTLSGSTQTARWAPQSANVLVDVPGPLLLTYYYQYLLGVTYSFIGGAPPSPLTLTGSSFGATSALPFGTSPSQEWLDVGSPYTLSNPSSSSTANERWYTPDTTSGILSSPGTISATYYHQYMISVVYGVVGGGSPAAASLTYTTLGSLASVSLSGSPQSLWADSGSQYSSSALLTGSGVAERWTTLSSGGTVHQSGTLTFAYEHQFLLAIKGSVLTSQWFNASSTAVFSVPGISGRSSGSGLRVASYTLDSGSLMSVVPTAGNVTISVKMDAAHILAINSVAQYQVTVSPSISSALSSITPPTISGDDYWYDQGTQVSLVLAGVWSRSSGSGERLVSYSLNGASQNVSSTGNVQVPAGPIASPISLSGVVTTQFSLSTGTGSIKSETGPSIAGDSGWYDSGTQVTIVYYFTWGGSSGMRQNAVGYSVNGGATKLTRSGTGTFPVQATMVSPKTVAVSSVVQYSLSFSGGNDVSLSLTSPTGDGFYDVGSNLTATTDYTWGLTGGNTRQNLVSFMLGPAITNVTREQNGTFTTPEIVFSGPQTLAFTAVTQYLVLLQFRDASGTETIVPSSVQIQVDDPILLTLPASGIWLDNGTKFQLYQVQWESTDVKPSNQTTYVADAPINQTVTDRVYAGSIIAKDYLGFPISGAQVSITLANGTTITRNTASDGSVNLGEIPIGSYTGSVSYLGTKTSVTGDASTQSTVEARVFASYPTLGLIAVLLVVIIVAFLFALRRRHPVQQVLTSSPTPTEPEKEQYKSVEPVAVKEEVAIEAKPQAMPVSPQTIACPSCGTSNTLPADFCQNCGKPLTEQNH